jgi:hypothetical protein
MARACVEEAELTDERRRAVPSRELLPPGGTARSTKGIPMSAPAPPGRFARVLVPLAALTRSREALETGAGLAAAVGARLEGLFVEDANLARLSALPFACEVESLTAAARALPLAAVERAFRVEAARFARLLAQSADRARVECTFQVARGQWIAEAAARDADLTVLVGSRRAVAGDRDRGRRRRVAVLFDASAPAQRGLAAATRLARAIQRELLILVPQSGTAAAADDEARSWLAAERLAGEALRLPPTAEALFALLRAHGGSTLTLPAAALSALAGDLAALVEDAPCALILVR